MEKVYIKRGTRAQLDTAATSAALHIGELYLITDENRMAVGLDNTTYESFAKLSEAGVGGGTPSGTTNSIQYNNAGAFGGASYVGINQGHILLADTPSVPTPVADSLHFFAERHAGRMLPSVMGPSGVDYNLQAALYGNTTYMWLAGTGTTAAINWGTSFSPLNSGTSAAQAHPAKTGTNALTSMNRATFGTGTTNTGSSGITSSATVAWLGNAANLGGFLFFARFGLEAISGTYRCFLGLSSTNTVQTADYSGVAGYSCIAVCKELADTNWQFLCRNGLANQFTKINTGIPVTLNQVLDVFIHSAPNSQGATVEIKDAVTGATLYLSPTNFANVPNSSLFMFMQTSINSVTGGAPAKLLALNRMYVETDL